MNPDLLFDVPEQLSPRLAWMKKHNIRINENLVSGGDCAFSAYMSGQPDCEVSYGKTEDDALQNLCIQYGLKLWFEENP